MIHIYKFNADIQLENNVATTMSSLEEQCRPWRSALSLIKEPERVFSMLLKIVNITNFHLEYRVGHYCPYAVIHWVQVRYFDENMPTGGELLLPELWPPNSAD